jgi:hypothetical protein
MRQIRVLVCGIGLVLALAPIGAFADEASDHSQDELVNAQAQVQVAQQEATAFADQAAMSAANEREIAFARSEALRQAQLNNATNAKTLEHIATTLAEVTRGNGDANARNELAILQIKANALVVKADGNVANAMAIGRADEIANAQAQSAALHELADYMTGTLAQQNMNNDEVMANDAADALVASADTEANNETAMGDDDVFAADTVLDAGDVAADSSTIEGDAQGDAVIAHAEDSLKNAEAMAADAP